MKPLVVLLEDSEDIAYLLRLRLEWAGFEVAVCSRVDEAIDTLRSRSGDVLVTDLHLRGESGFDALERVRTDPGLGGVPTLVITNTAREGDHQRALALGAHQVLGKSGDSSELVQALRDLFERAP